MEFDGQCFVSLLATRGTHQEHFLCVESVSCWTLWEGTSERDFLQKLLLMYIKVLWSQIVPPLFTHFILMPLTIVGVVDFSTSALVVGCRVYVCVINDEFIVLSVWMDHTWCKCLQVIPDHLIIILHVMPFYFSICKKSFALHCIFQSIHSQLCTILLSEEEKNRLTCKHLSQQDFYFILSLLLLLFF